MSAIWLSRPVPKACERFGSVGWASSGWLWRAAAEPTKRNSENARSQPQSPGEGSPPRAAAPPGHYCTGRPRNPVDQESLRSRTSLRVGRLDMLASFTPRLLRAEEAPENREQTARQERLDTSSGCSRSLMGAAQNRADRAIRDRLSLTVKMRIESPEPPTVRRMPCGRSRKPRPGELRRRRTFRRIRAQPQPLHMQ